MNDTQYPDSSGHKKAHRAFTGAVKKVITDFSEGKEIDLVELYAFISDWLVEHIILVDRSLGAYLNKCGHCTNAGHCKKHDTTSIRQIRVKNRFVNFGCCNRRRVRPAVHHA